MLAQFGIAENPVTHNLIGFYPARIRTGPAVVNNYFSSDSNTYDSYNGIIKIDHQFNEKHSTERALLRRYGHAGGCGGFACALPGVFPGGAEPDAQRFRGSEQRAFARA